MYFLPTGLRKAKANKRVVTGIILINLIGGIGLFTIIKYLNKKQNLPEHVIKKQKIETQNTEFTVYDLNTKPLTLSSLKNKIVLINFWATWCAPCIKELPSLNKLAEYYPKDLVILAVSNEPTDNIKNFLMAFPQFHANFIPANVGKKQMQATFSVQAFPETYILDKNGKLVEKIIGPRKWDSPEWKHKIKKLSETPP
ncbi:MAG: TlpA disulfide reductase family protein [Bdellovibrionales bacterium]|nr:TlpA disulfide reductase family protein [Bdellovibrionales bacterium]